MKLCVAFAHDVEICSSNMDDLVKQSHCSLVPPAFALQAREHSKVLLASEIGETPEPIKVNDKTHQFNETDISLIVFTSVYF